MLKIRNVAILVFLQQLKLTNFRNYEKINIKLDNNINIFYGNNAQDKPMELFDNFHEFKKDVKEYLDLMIYGIVIE